MMPIDNPDWQRIFQHELELARFEFKYWGRKLNEARKKVKRLTEDLDSIKKINSTIYGLKD